MEIVKTYGEWDKTELFNASEGAGELLKDQADGLLLDIKKLCIIRDTKEDGKTVDIMHIQTKEGALYSTSSPTMQKTVLKAIEFMETHELKFALFRSMSKAGRTFLNVKLV